jgi:hypothetical protein
MSGLRSQLALVPLLGDANLRPLYDLALNMVCPNKGWVLALLLRISEPEVDALKRHQIESLIRSYQNGSQLTGPSIGVRKVL